MAPSIRKNRFFSIAAVCLLVFMLGSCATAYRETDEAKRLHNQGQYAELAAFEISCKPKDEGCNQVHLLKGDACFRMGKNAADSQAQQAAFTCAADELTAGIKMTKAWQAVPIDRVKVYENACEAARLRADFGDRQRYETMLAATADQFFGFAPDHPGAVYYHARAGFHTLMRSANPCIGLHTLRTRIQNALQRFQSNPRYASPLHALLSVVGNEQRRRCGD
jgi:hypothetical protein